MIKDYSFAISFTPTNKDMGQIHEWLLKEQIERDEGFYCNWDLIKDAFIKNRLITIQTHNNVIGFVVWSRYKWVGRLDIVEVKPGFRNEGVGRYLVEETLKFFKKRRVVVVHLQCAPSSSEPIWKRLGFIEFPMHIHQEKYKTESNKKLYKILIKTMPYSNRKKGEVLELWNCEPIDAKDDSSKWSWELTYKNESKTLSLPIIHYAPKDWRLKWSNKGTIYRDDKVKYFNMEIDCESFIMIRGMH